MLTKQDYSFQPWSPEVPTWLKHTRSPTATTRNSEGPRKQHYPHTASQNNEIPFRRHLIQPTEMPDLWTELPFLMHRNHPSICDVHFLKVSPLTTSFHKQNAAAESILYSFFKKDAEKQALARYQKVMVTWLHVAVLKRRTSRRSSILITSWRICISW